MMMITTMLTTTVMTITTATTVMMALLLLLLLVVLRCYTESVPMVQQVRTNLDIRFHLFVVLAGQITANRGFPAIAAGAATDAVDRHLICTCASAAAAAAIQSIRFASLFVLFHIG